MKNIMKREQRSVPGTFGTVVDQLFQDNLSRFFDDSFWDPRQSGSSTVAPVNIRETANSFEMEMQVPGLRKERIRINASGKLLTVSYEEENASDSTGNGTNEREQNDHNRHVARQQAGTDSPKWIRQKYRLQAFSRNFQLGDSIDSGKIAARYENGILHLTLPKKENARQLSREIPVG